MLMKFDANDDLVCPNCGSSALHQEIVTVFDRGEDEAVVRQTTVGATVTVANVPNSDANPSSRRQGLSIVFECEGCPARPRLTIAQHKGNTVVRWLKA